jgi:hypothetical protein
MEVEDGVPHMKLHRACLALALLRKATVCTTDCA